MGKFAKLFELENDEQVLVTLNFDTEKYPISVSIRTDFKEEAVIGTIEFKEEKVALNFLELYSQEAALEFRTNIQQLMNFKSKKKTKNN